MDNTWTQASTMPRDAYLVDGSAFHPAWGIIMSGGYIGEGDDQVLISEDAQGCNSIDILILGTKLSAKLGQLQYSGTASLELSENSKHNLG